MKVFRFFPAGAILLLALLLLPRQGAVEAQGQLGDVDCDGVWTIADSLRVLQYGAGFTTGSMECPPPVNRPYLPAADVNADGDEDLLDALFILQCVNGISNVLCPPELPQSAEPASTQQSPTVRIEGKEIVVGGSEVTRLEAVNIGSPALCALTVDVMYLPNVKVPTGCVPDPSSNFDLWGCNPDYASNTVRMAAIDVNGVSGANIPLADITWTAVGSAGESTDLTVVLVTFADCSGAQITPVIAQGGVNTIVTPTPTPTPTPPSVGGIVEFQRDAAAPSAQQPGGAAPPYAALAGAAAAAALALTAGAWYTRRRWHT